MQANVGSGSHSMLDLLHRDHELSFRVVNSLIIVRRACTSSSLLGLEVRSSLADSRIDIIMGYVTGPMVCARIQWFLHR